MSEKCRSNNNKHNNNNNSDNPLTSRRTDGGKNMPLNIFIPRVLAILKTQYWKDIDGGA